MAHVYRILIGANGWLHPEWEDMFYPDDLPEDWQLGFYSNEFPVVLLSADTWQRVKGEITEWLEDCNDELGIVCEIPSSLLKASGKKSIASINQYINELIVLDGHLLAIVLPVVKVNPALEELLNEFESQVPVCIELDKLATEQDVKAVQKICEKKHWPLVWHGESDSAGLGYGDIAICRINGADFDMRQLREVVETMLKQTTLEQISILIIDGAPPEVATIRNANVILDLF